MLQTVKAVLNATDTDSLSTSLLLGFKWADRNVLFSQVIHTYV